MLNAVTACYNALCHHYINTVRVSSNTARDACRGIVGLGLGLGWCKLKCLAGRLITSGVSWGLALLCRVYVDNGQMGSAAWQRWCIGGWNILV
jgi:hypothetical protein